MGGRVAGRAAASGLLLAVILTACGTPEVPLPAGSAPRAATEAPASPSAAAEPESPAPDRSGQPARATPASVVIDGAQAAPVGLADVAENGTLNVPQDIDRLGWWVGSKPMGASAGTTLIAGHVDSAVAGLGYFARLTELAEGDPVTVVDGLGEEWQFTVSDTQQVGKEALPQELFDAAGERRLALVTCGGEFDQATGHYTDNFIVWATPA